MALRLGAASLLGSAFSDDSDSVEEDAEAATTSEEINSPTTLSRWAIRGSVGEFLAEIKGVKKGATMPNGTMRFPDDFIKFVHLREVKNVGKLRGSKQMGDYTDVTV